MVVVLQGGGHVEVVRVKNSSSVAFDLVAAEVIVLQVRADSKPKRFACR